jgi:hypothetical protein
VPLLPIEIRSVHHNEEGTLGTGVKSLHPTFSPQQIQLPQIEGYSREILSFSSAIKLLFLVGEE